jgi:hypothetical protein
MHYPVLALSCIPPLQRVALKCNKLSSKIRPSLEACVTPDCSVKTIQPYDLLYSNGERLGSFREGVIWFDYDTTGEEIISVFAKVCEDDFDKIIPVFEQKYQTWLDDYETHLSNDLKLEPFSPSREANLIDRRNDLLECHYEEFEKVDNWLIITRATRAYCYIQEYGVMSGCPATTFSYTRFFLFLIHNVSKVTFPYLMGYILIFALPLGISLFHWRRGDLGYFFKPNLYHFVLILLLLPVLYSNMLIHVTPHSHGVVIASYLLASLTVYIYYRIRNG